MSVEYYYVVSLANFLYFLASSILLNRAPVKQRHTVVNSAETLSAAPCRLFTADKGLTMVKG